MRFLLVSMFILSAFTTFSQNEKPINSGAVFIDGKYVEPPYKVEQRGMAVIINGTKIIKMQMPKSPYRFKKCPRMPTETLNKNSELSEIFKIKHPDYDGAYIYVIEKYYLEKYPYNIACDSIKRLYSHLPNVKSVESQNNREDTFTISSYNGESRVYSLSPYGKRHSIAYGPESKEYYSKKILISSANGEAQSIREKLEQNKMVFFFVDKDLVNRANSYTISEEKSRQVYEILQSDIEDNQKIDSLDNIFINIEFLRRLIREYQKTEKIKTSFDKVYESRENLENIDNIHETKNNNQKNQAYSPQNTTINAWCPNPWEFTEFNTDELPNIINYVNNQGYIYSSSNVFTDNTPGDNDFGSCTYYNLSNMSSSGLLYLASHGNPNAGLYLVFASDPDYIYQWCSYNTNIQVEQISPSPAMITIWGDNEMWAAVANHAWAIENWTNNLVENKTISVLSCCYSSANGWVDACTGGICFGYNETTHWGWIFDQGIDYNNRNLFERMNGKKDAAANREAIDAYNGMPDHKDGFTYNSNASITLCPSISLKYPDENETVASNVQSGYIKFDTWCDASQPANQALTFSVQNGDISDYFDVYWVGGDVKSNQINFDWSGTHGNITVNVNPEFIKAYNGGQNLDYDGETPNTEIGMYSFTVNDAIPTEAPIANFSWSVNNYTVEFMDLSENIPTTWIWEFGDGTTSSNQNPTHTYYGDNSYSVTLTVSNNFGSNSISKNININSNTNTFEISGIVYGESFNEISGATVSGEGYSDITDSNGRYSINVASGWSGALSASAQAQGYTSYTQPFNPVFADTEYDFYLSEVPELFISTTNEHPSECPIPQVKYKVEGGSGSWDYTWYLNGVVIGYGWFITIAQLNLDENIVKVDIITDDDTFYSLTKNVYVTEACQLNTINASISQDCFLINVGTTVHFYETSLIPEHWENYMKRNWNIDEGGNDEIITEKKSTFEINPYNFNYIFNYIGHKIIKLSYWESHRWDIFNNYNLHICDAWTGVNVIDCDLISTLITPPMLPFGIFSGAVYDDWEYNNNTGPIYIYGGSFVFDGAANNHLNRDLPITLSACKEIIINGDVEFIADGAEELILEIKTPCNYESANDKSQFYSSNDTINNFIVENAYCYPNPFSDNVNLYFEIKSDKVLNVQILDMLGKEYFKNTENFNSGSHLLSFSTHELPPATYIIRVFIDDSLKTFKIVKQ